MKFFVTRTSSKEKPCDEAKEIMVNVTDYRKFKTLKEWQHAFPSDFNVPLVYKSEFEGGCKRVLEEKFKYFYVDDDILEFIKRNGECIVSFENNYLFEEWPTVEIYDDYRE